MDSDFPALALGQKPAQAMCQKPGQAWAKNWLRVAYGPGFQFGRPITWALASAPVLAGHRPQQANSREPGVTFFCLFLFQPAHQLFAATCLFFCSSHHVALVYNPTLFISIALTMSQWDIKMVSLFFCTANHVVLSHSEDLPHCKTHCQKCR